MALRLGVWGANTAESDLAPWRVLGFAAKGLGANPAESDLSPWWVFGFGS